MIPIDWKDIASMILLYVLGTWKLIELSKKYGNKATELFFKKVDTYFDRRRSEHIKRDMSK